MSRVLVTGASGFVGTALCERLLASGYRVRRALRSQPAPPLRNAQAGEFEDCFVGDVGPRTEWFPALQGVDAVVHLAARVHVTGPETQATEAEYLRVNRDGTARLAEACAAVGVRRLVFVSSVKVQGEASQVPCQETHPPEPVGPYALSKLEAEQALWSVATTSALEGVVVRPPLVYGPGVKANFLRLLQLVERRVPLPLGSVRNRRSLVFVGNLVDALVSCVSHRLAAGETFLVADGAPVSTPDLMRAIARALNTSPRLLPMPPALLAAAASMIGARAVVQRLCGSLELDTSRVRSLLDWHPPYTLESGLAETARWYMAQRNGVKA